MNDENPSANTLPESKYNKGETVYLKGICHSLKMQTNKNNGVRNPVKTGRYRKARRVGQI